MHPCMLLKPVHPRALRAHRLRALIWDPNPIIIFTEHQGIVKAFDCYYRSPVSRRSGAEIPSSFQSGEAITDGNMRKALDSKKAEMQMKMNRLKLKLEDLENDKTNLKLQVSFKTKFSFY